MNGRFEPINAHTEETARIVVDSALAVHRALGPGLLESAFEECLCHELSRRNVHFKRQLSVPILYEGVRLDSGLRLDLLVDECVIVEIKAVEEMKPVFEAQLLTYLRLSRLRLGLLINFNVVLWKDGIKRMVV